jgi:cytoskeletal protein RodZ
VSIGDTLAEARRQAGLTVTQVSQRTCIRETIIRGIERGDYSACGGDFYARGHIRSIARAVGADPDPLIREYDQVQGAPQVTAADVFEPATPIRIRERRRPNWSVAMVVALALLVGFVVYHVVSSSSPAKPVASQHVGASSHKSRAHPKPTATSVTNPNPNAVVIHLTATENCWVELTTSSGRQIFQGVINAGASKRWTEHQPVSLVLGNPAGVALTVNGKNAVPTGATQPVTLTLGPGQKTSGG